MSYLPAFDLTILPRTSMIFRNDEIWRVLFNKKCKGFQLPTSDFLWHDVYFERIQVASGTLLEKARRVLKPDSWHSIAKVKETGRGHASDKVGDDGDCLGWREKGDVQMHMDGDVGRGSKFTKE
jgi:hypothetical protein